MSTLTRFPPASALPVSADGDVVNRLRDSALFRDYQDAFQTATGLPLILRAAGCVSAADQSARNISAFCALMAGRNDTCAACVQMHAAAEASTDHSPQTRACFAGLNDSLVPVRLGERTVGYLQTGQVLFAAPT